MVIYKELFLEEDMSIQDGQDSDGVGIDLDQVEDNIMGDDALESHSDELEYATKVDINPVEEAARIMYESEYNWNQMMQTIGLQELSAFSTGREMILEANDIRGYFEKAKNFFVRMFEKITTAFKKFMNKIDIMAKMDKKFVSQNKSKMEKGFNETNWGDFKGFEYPTVNLKYVEPKEMDYTNFSNFDDGEGYSDSSFKDDSTVKSSIIKNCAGIDSTSEISEMNKKLLEKMRGSKDMILLKGKIKLNDIVDILKSDRDTNKIRDEYSGMKKAYNKLLKNLEQAKKKAVDGNSSNYSHSLVVLNKKINYCKFEKNVQNAVYALRMKIAREKRSQARKLAHRWVGLSYDVNDKKKAVGESGSVFSSLNFV